MPMMLVMYRRVVAQPEERGGQPGDPRVERDGGGQAQGDGQRQGGHDEDQRVERRLAHQLVGEQPQVVLHADDVDGERVADVGAAHVGEAHAEPGQQRTGPEHDEHRR